MNRKQIIILICAFTVSVLIVWHDLPIEFPGTIVKVFKLFMKIAAVVALTILASLFAGGKKKSS